MLELFDNGVIYKNEVFDAINEVPFEKNKKVSICDFCSDIYYQPIQIDIKSLQKRNLIFKKTLETYYFDLKKYHWEVYQGKDMDKRQYVLILVPKKRMNLLLKEVKRKKLRVVKHEPYFISVLNEQFSRNFCGIVLVDEGHVLRAVYIKDSLIIYYRVIPQFNFSVIDKNILKSFPWEKESVVFGLYPQRIKRIEAWLDCEFT